MHFFCHLFSYKNIASLKLLLHYGNGMRQFTVSFHLKQTYFGEYFLMADINVNNLNDEEQNSDARASEKSTDVFELSDDSIEALDEMIELIRGGLANADIAIAACKW
jgi:hypothetical protein